MQHKKLEFAERYGDVTRIFTAFKLRKHFSVCAANDQSITSCGMPGDYIVVDEYYNIYVFDRSQFKKAFGHKRMELLD